MTENSPPLAADQKYRTLEWDQLKAQSNTLGLPKIHRDLESHENEFDAGYQEHQYQEATKQLEASGRVERIVVDEPGCLPLVLYRIGEPDFIITSHIHGDEPGPAIPLFLQLTKRILANDPDLKNVLIIPRCNEEAYLQLSRGINLDQTLLEQIAGKDYHISVDNTGKSYIDLNRQYIERNDSQQPALDTLFPKARQLLRAVRTYAPQAQDGFSFHADNEKTTMQIEPQTNQLVKVMNGSYVYDIPKKFPESANANSEEEIFFKECIANFQKQMKERNIPLLNGIDDVSDALLGQNEFVDGYACTPALEKKVNGQVVHRSTQMHDQTFETAMVRWGMDRIWCFETAGWINPDRRAETIRITLETIVLPIMKYKEMLRAHA